MNSEIIIKALEWAIEKEFCSNCLCTAYGKSIVEFYKEILALINSQEQRIGAQDMTISELRKRVEKAEHDADRYAQRIKELEQCLEHEHASFYKNGYEAGYNKGINEFAERAKTYYKNTSGRPLPDTVMEIFGQYGEKCDRLTEENERLRAENKALVNENVELKNQIQEEISEEDINLFDEFTKLLHEGIREAKANNVSEIKTRFAMRYGTYTDKDMTPITEVFRVLDQIAKEMLEGDNERQTNA